MAANDAQMEQKFATENGMTVQEAWEKVKEWHLAGKSVEAERGAQIIVQYFPTHPAQQFLHEANAKSNAKPSIATKLGGAFADSVEHLLTKKKKPKATPIPDQASVSETSTTSTETAPELLPEPTTPVLDDERLFATIAYAWIFCIIPLLMKRESAFVQFHAKQGLVMAILLTVFDFTIGALLSLITGGLGLLLKMIYIALLAYAAYQAWQGKKWKIPLISKIAEKIAL